MNKNNMAQVFAHYIDNFAKINDEAHEEYYKWQICYEFPKLMDKALGGRMKNFPLPCIRQKSAVAISLTVLHSHFMDW